MGFNHRVPALCTAILASAALGLSILSGLSCEFLDVTAEPDMYLVSANGNYMTGIQEATIGILCIDINSSSSNNNDYSTDGYYDLEGDQMWELSRLFLLIGWSLGSVTCLLAWAVTTVLPPTEFNWRLISFCASISAVVQVPIFLIFESEPCSEYKENQSCSLGIGSYYLMASVVLWVAVTLATQLLDPPMWAMELSAWRVVKCGQSRQRGIDDSYDYDEYDDYDGDVDDPDAQPMHQQREGRRRIDMAGWIGDPRNLHANSTESLQEEDFDDGILQHQQQRSFSRSPAGGGRSKHSRSIASNRGGGDYSIQKMDPRIEISDEAKTAISEEKHAKRRQMTMPGGKDALWSQPVNDHDNATKLQSTTSTSHLAAGDFNPFKESEIVDLDSKLQFTDEVYQTVQQQQQQQNLVGSSGGDEFAMSSLRIASRQSQQQGQNSGGPSNINTGNSHHRVQKGSKLDAIDPTARNVSLLDGFDSIREISTYAAADSPSRLTTMSYESNATPSYPQKSIDLQNQQQQTPDRPVYTGLNAFNIERASSPVFSGTAILSDLQASAPPLSTAQTSTRSSKSPSSNRPSSTIQVVAELPSIYDRRQSVEPLSSDTHANDNDPFSYQGSVQKYSTGLRALTSKIKSDTRRKRSRRRNRRGYTQMLDDDYYSDDSIEDNSKTPPFTVHLQPRDQFLRTDVDLLHEITDDEQEEVMNDWNALHHATASGAAIWRHEEDNRSLDSFAMNRSLPGNSSPSSYHESNAYHSDPEPQYFSSEHSRSETSFDDDGAAAMDTPYQHDESGDNSTLSSRSSSSSASHDGAAVSAPQYKAAEGTKDKSGRWRKSIRGGRSARRHKAIASSVSSMKSSGSLLSATINEETMQDIIAESSGGEDEVLRPAFTLQRTKSAPASWRRSLDRIEVSRELGFSIRAPVSPSHPAVVTPQSQTNEEEDHHAASRNVFSEWNLLQDYERPTPIADGSLLNESQGVQEKAEADAVEENTAVDQVRSLSQFESNHLDKAKSLSPTRSRKLNSFEWKDNLEPVGMMRARATSDKNSMELETTGMVDLAERARLIRKQRLQNQKSARPEFMPLQISFDEDITSSERNNTITPLSYATSENSDVVGGSERSNDLPLNSGNIVNELMTTDSSANLEGNISEGHETEDSREMFQKYGSTKMMDDLDLELTIVRRPVGAEYGDDEASL